MLLSKHQVLAALRFIRGIGGHDNISARKFLDAAKQTDDVMLFYTIFRFFEQRNQRLRGNPNFTPGKGRPRVTSGNGGGGLSRSSGWNLGFWGIFYIWPWNLYMDESGTGVPQF